MEDINKKLLKNIPLFDIQTFINLEDDLFETT